MARLVYIALFSLMAFGVSLPSFSQGFPDRPIRIVYPFPPGGSDVVVRVFSERLSAALGQPVIIDNRGGAGGNIGAQLVASAPGDGYTLLMGTNGPLVINPLLYKDMNFDPQKDFVPISGFVRAPQVLFVNLGVPAKSLGDLIALAKSKPGNLTYGSVGQGSASHLTMELFKSAADIDIIHVPYKGAGPAITDVIGGRVSMMVVIAGSAMPHVRGGKVRALAITSAAPSALVPGVPTMASAGYAGVEANAWLALVAPTGTPKEILTRLNGEMDKILTDSSIKDRLAGLGFETDYTRADDLSARFIRERDMWSKVIKSTGVRLE